MAALKWANANAARLGADPHKVSVGGDSAGGNLAAVVAQLTKQSKDAPAAQLLIYPRWWIWSMKYASRKALSQGLFLSELDIELANAAYVGTSQLTLHDPLVTPLLGDLNDLPPALIITAAFDALRDEGEAYAERMLTLGNRAVLERVAGLGHGFINMTPLNRQAKKATIKMAKDFRQLLNSL